MALILVDITLCFIIALLGILGFKKTKNITLLSIGSAFLLFGVSHILALFGLNKTLIEFIIAIKVIAYLLILFALYKVYGIATKAAPKSNDTH